MVTADLIEGMRRAQAARKATAWKAGMVIGHRWALGYRYEDCAQVRAWSAKLADVLYECMTDGQCDAVWAAYKAGWEASENG